MRIVTIRKFWMMGALIQVGAQMELPEGEARALITAGKAEAAAEAAPAPAHTEELEANASTPTENGQSQSVKDVQSLD